METSLCDQWLQQTRDKTEVSRLRSTRIANVVLNSFLCYAATTLNILAIYGIRKASALPRTLRILLISLAVSDLGVGLFVQPFFISTLVKLLRNDNSECESYGGFRITLTMFCHMASFGGTVAISLDRFLAVHFHLRYEELVTHKRVVVVVISIWTLSAFLSMMWLWLPMRILGLVSLDLGILLHALTAMAYIRIYFAVRRHKNQIQSLQIQCDVPHPGEMANFAGLIKSVVGVFYVYLVFLICYLPFFVCTSVLRMKGFHTTTTLAGLMLFSYSLVFFNSTLNPILYCWKMKHIRRTIINMLRQILAWYTNRFLQSG